MTDRAAQMELADAGVEQDLTPRARRLQPRVGGRRQRQAARLQADEGRQPQQLGALGRPGRPALVDAAALVDALGQVQRPGRAAVEGRVAGGHADHALLRVSMAGGAGLVGAARPQLGAVLHPQHGRVLGVVALHGLQRRAQLLEARALLCTGGQGGREQQQRRPGLHVAVSVTVSVCAKPWSPVQLKLKLPLSPTRSGKAR